MPSLIILPAAIFFAAELLRRGIPFRLPGRLIAWILQKIVEAIMWFIGMYIRALAGDPVAILIVAVPTAAAGLIALFLAYLVITAIVGAIVDARRPSEPLPPLTSYRPPSNPPAQPHQSRVKPYAHPKRGKIIH